MEQLRLLSAEAWVVRESAFTFGSTKVGCAILTRDGKSFFGCNIEHRFRCHDIHAEVSAVSAMISSGSSSIAGVLVVAERAFFTPCGGCLDWIMQFADDDTVVAIQGEPGAALKAFTVRDLMPHYPH
ncbi:MAG: cytidine deaminase [Candidatus Eremiobacteraeota bacterium]|nr:cytidine deaminase [Candidatus Eremiobacteraeota bacterium]